MNKKILVILLASALTGCSLFSPYGEDNTPKPAALTQYAAAVQPKVIWQQNVGSGSDGHYLRLTPCIANSTIYTVDNRGVLTATSSSGKKVWQKALNIAVKSGVGTNGQILVFVDDEAVMHVVSAADGKALWQGALSDQALAAPAVTNDMILAKTIDGNVTAFDLNGKQLWQYQHDVPNLMLRAASPVLVAGNIGYVGFADGKVVALNLKTGDDLWQQVAAEPQGFAEIERLVDIDANLELKNNRLFVATYQGKVTALNPQNGNILWQKGNSVYAGIIANDKALFAVAADGTIDAYNQADGKSLWQQKALGWRFLTGPALYANALVMGDLEGYLHFVNLTNGELLGRVEVNRKSNIIDAPMVNNNQLITLDTKGSLSAVAVK